MSELLQTDEKDSSSSVDTTSIVVEDKKIDDDKTMDLVSNAVAAVDDLWYIKDKLYTAVLKSLSDDGTMHSCITCMCVCLNLK